MWAAVKEIWLMIVVLTHKWSIFTVKYCYFHLFKRSQSEGALCTGVFRCSFTCVSHRVGCISCVMIVTPHHTSVQQSSARQIAAECWSSLAQLLLQWCHTTSADLHTFSFPHPISVSFYPSLPSLFVIFLIISSPISSPSFSPMCQKSGRKVCMTDGEI